MILLIDATRGRDVRVGVHSAKLFQLRRVFNRPGSVLVQLIDELLKKHKVRVADVTAVIVATGPGPFSSLRAGVGVGNTLGYVLHIPVVGVVGELTMTELLKQGKTKLKAAKVGLIISPNYGQAPNITKRKNQVSL